MKLRIKKYEEGSPVEFLLLREQLGMKRYRKHSKRDEEKRRILLELGLKRIEEKEKGDLSRWAIEEEGLISKLAFFGGAGSDPRPQSIPA